MVAAFSRLRRRPRRGLREFGLGLALAVLHRRDRRAMILVPSLMAVFGRWNWWLPQGRGPEAPPPQIHAIYLTIVIARRIAGSW